MRLNFATESYTFSYLDTCFHSLDKYACSFFTALRVGDLLASNSDHSFSPSTILKYLLRLTAVCDAGLLKPSGDMSRYDCGLLHLEHQHAAQSRHRECRALYSIPKLIVIRPASASSAPSSRPRSLRSYLGACSCCISYGNCSCGQEAIEDGPGWRSSRSK